MVLVNDPLSDSSKWYYIYDTPAMILDHAKIVENALRSLRNYFEVYPLGREFLPPKFTMPELHELYEKILHTKHE